MKLVNWLPILIAAIFALCLFLVSGCATRSPDGWAQEETLVVQGILKNGS